MGRHERFQQGFHLEHLAKPGLFIVGNPRIQLGLRLMEGIKSPPGQKLNRPGFSSVIDVSGVPFWCLLRIYVDIFCCRPWASNAAGLSPFSAKWRRERL